MTDELNVNDERPELSVKEEREKAAWYSGGDSPLIAAPAPASTTAPPKPTMAPPWLPRASDKLPPPRIPLDDSRGSGHPISTSPSTLPSPPLSCELALARAFWLRPPFAISSPTTLSPSPSARVEPDSESPLGESGSVGSELPSPSSSLTLSLSLSLLLSLSLSLCSLWPTSSPIGTPPLSDCSGVSPLPLSAPPPPLAGPAALLSPPPSLSPLPTPSLPGSRFSDGICHVRRF